MCRMCLKLHKVPKEIDPSLTHKENLKMLRYLSIMIAEEERDNAIENEKLQKEMEKMKGSSNNQTRMQPGSYWKKEKMGRK